MIDIAHGESRLQLAYLNPRKDGKRVGKRAQKVGKTPDWWKQCANCHHAKNCRLQISICKGRFAGCGFAHLSNLLPTFTGWGWQAQSRVSIGLQGCLPTLPTYLIKWGSSSSSGGCVQEVYRRCTCTGSKQGLASRQGRQPPFCDPHTPPADQTNAQFSTRSGARHVKDRSRHLTATRTRAPQQAQVPQPSPRQQREPDPVVWGLALRLMGVPGSAISPCPQPTPEHARVVSLWTVDDAEPLPAPDGDPFHVVSKTCLNAIGSHCGSPCSHSDNSHFATIANANRSPSCECAAGCSPSDGPQSVILNNAHRSHLDKGDPVDLPLRTGTGSPGSQAFFGQKTL